MTFIADKETLAGSLVSDSISSITASLRDGTTLTGSINSAALELDSTSRWEVTGDSVLTSLTDTGGISGSTITNIAGNGFTVLYDANLTASSALGGKTYSLVNGGTLKPGQSSTPVTKPTASPTVNPTSGPITVPDGGYGQVYFFTTPRGASVILDGNPTGTITPISMKVPIGTHQVIFRRAGSSDLQKTFEVTLNYRTTVSGNLVPGSGAIPTQPVTTVITSGPTTTATQVTTIPTIAPVTDQNRFVNRITWSTWLKFLSPAGK